MNRELIKLGDVADLIYGPAFKSTFFLDVQSEGTKLVRGDNVQQGYIRWGDKTKKWPAENCDVHIKYQLQVGDIVLAMDRPIVGGGLKLAWISEDDLPALLVQRVCRIRGQKNLAYTDFLRYVLSSQEFSAHVEKITTGANIPHISGKDIAAYEFKLLSLEEQKQIVSALKAYDDLIAINQRRIELLEEAARRLYREWFVHLRFPGHEANPIEKGTPAGWERRALSDIADFINGYAFKPAHRGEVGLPIVKIPELRDGVSKKTPFNSGADILEKYHIKDGDVIFSWSATLLINEWNSGPALLNQHLFKVVPKEGFNNRFVRFSVEYSIPEMLGSSVGTTMRHIRRSALDAQKVLVPTKPTMVEFGKTVDSYIDQVMVLNKQNSLLQQARDQLLPKLMSGQLDISRIKTESLIAEAG